MKIVLCLTLFLFGFTCVFAQQKTISQAEFDTAISNNAPDKWREKSYRLTITSESRMEGRPQSNYLTKSITEYASPTLSRFTHESNFGSKNSKNEAITIGNKKYIRKGNEAWREGKFENNSQPINESTKADSQFEYRFLGTEQINAQTAYLYAKIEKRKRTDSATNKETFSTITNKYWLGENGMILKSDMEMESRTGEAIQHSRVTQIWEADANIRIEAPRVD
jgi:hypothetical protein